MEKFKPQEIATRFGSIILSSVDYQLNNEKPELQKILSDLYVSSTLTSIFDKQKKNATDTIKKMFAEKLAQIGEHDLTTVNPFNLTAKVTSPRETFDSEAFIKAVSEKYDLSMIDLRAIAALCTKKSAAPVSLTVSLMPESEF